MLVRYFALIATLIILSLAMPAFAAESNGTIEGQIINGTKDGSSVANLQVSLKTRLNDAEVSSTTAQTDSQGNFAFKGLATEPGYRYQVTLKFQQVQYHSELVGFDDGGTTKPVKVKVFDSTTSDEAISTAMAHTVIYIEEGSLRVKEIFFFVNNSDRTYIGSKEIDNKGNKETLRFNLPEAATELQASRGLMESRMQRNQSGFVDSLPVLPGPREVSFSYTVPRSKAVYTLSHSFNYPTARYDLLFQGEAIRITRGRLVQDSPLEIQGTVFNHFSGVDLARGEVFAAELSSLPTINKASSPNTMLWVSIVLLAIAGGLVLFYFLKQRRQPPPVPAKANAELRRQKLLGELGTLDDEFEAGKLSEEVYRKRRAEKKAELVSLIQKLTEENVNR